MTIYEINKLLSSSNKSKLISHFWDCKCQNHDVTHMINKLQISQSNLSKHINILLKMGVLNVKQEGKARYYKINPNFKKEWFNIIDPQIDFKSNKEYKCQCENKYC